jgi:AcrR family transcriptional regulator
VDAALAVLDAEGLDALTMRRVATALGTGPASLYAHVADKDEMVAAVLDRVAGEIEVPDRIDPKRWRVQLKALAHSMREVYGRHRGIARAGLGVIPTGEQALGIADVMVGILLAGGVSRRVAALSVDLLALYCTAISFEDDIRAAEGGTGAAHEDDEEEFRAFFAALPVDRFPHLVSMAGPLTAGDGDERFDFGLDLIIRGIASTVRPAASR